MKKACTFVTTLLLSFSNTLLADADLTSTFTNTNSVASTRHNLTQQDPQRSAGAAGSTSVMMNQYRNNYGEVCVYCHTPHGANTTTTAPLWNRTMRTDTTYTTYSSMSIDGTVGDPGVNSLTCLSCHDGRVAVDSIINMPGSGKYLKTQETTQNNSFLSNSWTNASGPDATVHIGLDPTPASGCLACHTPDAGVVGAGATDFTVFALGTDLSNDHPIGVPYRGLTAGTDYEGGTTTSGNLLFFDRDGDSRADKDEVRFYNTGGGFEVECASCHDPHGVPSGGAGSAFIGTFLRIANAESALCLTCHTK